MGVKGKEILIIGAIGSFLPSHVYQLYPSEASTLK